LQQAAASLPIPAGDAILAECLDFIAGRMRSLFIDQGARYDVADAVLAAQYRNPAAASRAVAQLGKWVSSPDWVSILPAYSRCVRITRDQKEQYPVKPEKFSDAAEKDLFTALQKAQALKREPGSVDDLFAAFVPMISAINKFFDSVLVMSEDQQERGNRLGLLQQVASLADGVADFSKLEGF
jgi:glycyl-tRNA synthetase beta subunit